MCQISGNLCEDVQGQQATGILGFNSPGTGAPVLEESGSPCRCSLLEALDRLARQAPRRLGLWRPPTERGARGEEGAQSKARRRAGTSGCGPSPSAGRILTSVTPSNPVARGCICLSLSHFSLSLPASVFLWNLGRLG